MLFDIMGYLFQSAPASSVAALNNLEMVVEVRQEQKLLKMSAVRLLNCVQFPFTKADDFFSWVQYVTT